MLWQQEPINILILFNHKSSIDGERKAVIPAGSPSSSAGDATDKIWIVPSWWRNLGTAPGHLPCAGGRLFSKLRKNAKAILNMPRLKQSVELAKQTNAKEQFCYHLQQQEPGIIITGQGRCWEFLAVGTETGHESI